MALKWFNDREGSNHYNTNEYLSHDDVNLIIDLFNKIIVTDNSGKFKGLQIPEGGLSLFFKNTDDSSLEWKLTVDNNGILQTEQIISN